MAGRKTAEKAPPILLVGMAMSRIPMLKSPTAAGPAKRPTSIVVGRAAMETASVKPESLAPNAESSRATGRENRARPTAGGSVAQYSTERMAGAARNESARLHPPMPLEAAMIARADEITLLVR